MKLSDVSVRSSLMKEDLYERVSEIASQLIVLFDIISVKLLGLFL